MEVFLVARIPNFRVVITEAVIQSCSLNWENFAKFTGKHMYQSLFNKVASLAKFLRMLFL